MRESVTANIYSVLTVYQRPYHALDVQVFFLINPDNDLMKKIL